MTNFSMDGHNNQSPNLELLRQVNVYLNKIAELDPVPRSEHLARLDHLIGFKVPDVGVSKVQSPSKVYLLAEAKAAGLEINSALEAEIEHSDKDDVLFAIKMLKWKLQQEPVDNPNGYFYVVLKGRQLKRDQGNQAA